MTTLEAGVKIQLDLVQVDLLWNNELLGSGLIIDESFGHQQRHFNIELPTTRRLVQQVTDGLGTTTSIQFKVRLRGSGSVTVPPGSNAGAPSMVGDPQSGQPIHAHFTSQNDFGYPVPRSEWYEKVVSSLGDGDYLALDVLVPRGATGAPWQAALKHIEDARRAYTNGDDPAVFLHLRGAFDAIPGAKQKIFDSLDEPKRTEVNALVGALSGFLHSGRHVAEEDGTFPVDHIDAGLALNLMTVLVSYTSRALEAAANRG